jgi:3-methylcrotonyl-CoA carboxylase beta subunit
MPRIQSEIDPSSERFRANHDRMTALAADLRKQLETASLGGGEDARRKHTARGKLLPRERVQSLLDTAARSSSCHRWRRTACMAGMRPQPG